jgi:hypothetical protein
MNPEPDQPPVSRDASDPPLSRHSPDVQREPAEEALTRARRTRPAASPVDRPAGGLREVIGGWSSRHPCTAVTVIFAAGFLFGLCTPRGYRR